MAEDAFDSFVEGLRAILHEADLGGNLHPTGVFVPESGYRRDPPPAPPDPHIFVRWSPGGVSGGSCWGDSSPRRHTDDEPEPDLVAFDVILERIKPDLTYLQYRRLERGLIKSVGWTEDEYYGNSTDYTVKSIRLRDLFDRFVAEGWL